MENQALQQSKCGGRVPEQPDLHYPADEVSPFPTELEKAARAGMALLEENKQLKDRLEALLDEKTSWKRDMKNSLASEWAQWQNEAQKLQLENEAMRKQNENLSAELDALHKERTQLDKIRRESTLEIHRLTQDVQSKVKTGIFAFSTLRLDGLRDSCHDPEIV